MPSSTSRKCAVSFAGSGPRPPRDFVDEPASGVHAVHAEIHERAAAGETGIDQPRQGSAGQMQFAERRVDDIDTSEGAFLDQLL